MHAGSIILLWVAVVLLVQLAEGGWLAALIVGSLAVALVCAREQCVRLLARVCILLLAILVLFAWFTPGEAFFMDWPRASPSREGLALAFAHGGRLVAVVCWVSILLGRMSTDRLVSGLYALLRPCSALGLPAERIALRLLLVLRYVGTAHKGGSGGWRCGLDLPDEGGGEIVRLTRERLGIVDVAALGAAGILLLAVWWLW